MESPTRENKMATLVKLQLTEYVESSFLIHQDVYRDLSVCSL